LALLLQIPALILILRKPKRGGWYLLLLEELSAFLASLTLLGDASITENLELLIGLWIEPYVWPFSLVLHLLIAALIMIYRKPKWWKWVILLTAEVTAIFAAGEVVNHHNIFPGFSGMRGVLCGMGHIVLFNVLSLITLICWVVATCRKKSKRG
jgi:hypothetical protein